MYTRWCSNKIFFIKVKQVVFLQRSLQLSFCLYPILNSILRCSVEMLHVYVLLVLFPNPWYGAHTHACAIPRVWKQDYVLACAIMHIYKLTPY